MTDAIHNTFSNSVNPNTSSYRIEHGTFQTDNKSHRLYKVKTGNIFNDKQTFSLKTAIGWAELGETVLVINSNSGYIVGMLTR